MLYQSSFLDERGLDWSTGLAPPPVDPGPPSPLDWLEAADFGGITPHPYQVEAFDRIFRRFEKGDKSTLLVLPTGTGKTITFGMIARYVTDVLGKRVLIVAHRDKLIEQAAQKAAFLGLKTAIEKADQKAFPEVLKSEQRGDPIRCVVGSVQTLRKSRLEKYWPRDFFRLIITDECHHATSTSYKAMFTHFDSAWSLGVTATPNRADKRNLGEVYQNLAYEYSLYDAVQEEYLCRLTLAKLPVRVDLRDVRTVTRGFGKGDFNVGDLTDRVQAALNLMVPEIKKVIGDRRTMLFAPDRRSAAAFADALKQVGVRARDVHGESPDKEVILREYSEGVFQVLCSCDLLTEGYDEPPVACIVLCRATRSASLLMQMVGRGTRNHPSKELLDPKGTIIADFEWQVDPGILANPVSLIAPKWFTEEHLALATASVKERPVVDLMDAVEEADGMLLEAKRLAREKAKAEAERLARLRVAVRDDGGRYEWRMSDPLGADRNGNGPVYEASSIPRSEPVLGVFLKPYKTANPEPMTPGQKQRLVLWGFTDPELRGWTRRLASEVIGRIGERMSSRMATYKQVRTLIRNRVPAEEARALTSFQASGRLDVLIGNRRVG